MTEHPERLTNIFDEDDLDLLDFKKWEDDMPREDWWYAAQRWLAKCRTEGRIE